MRAETFLAWVFVGFWLLVIGTVLLMLEVRDGLAMFLTAIGFAYLIIGIVLAFLHDRHMAKRTRARQE